MIVLGALLALIVWQLSRVPRVELRGLALVVVLIFGVQFFFALLHQADMALIGIPEYGSDPLFYWNDVVRVYEGTQEEFTPQAVLFKWFSFAIVLTSFTPGILLVRVGNILLLLSSLIVVYQLLRRNQVSPRVVLWVLLMSGLNGIVIWTTIRHLKDIFFVTLTIWYIAIIDVTLRRTRHSWVLLGVFAFIFYQAMILLRPWGFLIVLILPIAMWLSFERNHRYRFVVVLLALVPLIFILPKLTATIQYASIVSVFEFRRGILGLAGAILSMDMVLGIARFLVGPGPLLAAFGNERFLYSTMVSNILIFAGSLFWWFHLPRIFVLAVRAKGKVLFVKRMLPFLILAIMTLFVYVIAYGGTAEVRFRAMLYLYTYPLLGYMIAQSAKDTAIRRANTKTLTWLAIAVFIPAALVASWWELINTTFK